MSNKTKKIKDAPRNVQALAAKFRQQHPVSAEGYEPVFKEITSDLIKEVFKDQFA